SFRCPSYATVGYGCVGAGDRASIRTAHLRRTPLQSPLSAQTRQSDAAGQPVTNPQHRQESRRHTREVTMTSGVIQKPDVAEADAARVVAPGPKPLTEGRQPVGILIGLWAFVVVPFVALIVSIPLAWGGALTWTDVIIGAVFYVISGLGITVGFHRYLTHGSFKAKRW